MGVFVVLVGGCLGGGGVVLLGGGFWGCVWPGKDTLSDKTRAK